MPKLCLALPWIALSLPLMAACSDDPDPAEVAPRDEALRCAADLLESDLSDDPFEGPGVDAESGALQLEPGLSYVVSSTYGAPRPDGDGNPVPPRYLELFGAVQEQLMKTPGLVALRLSNSRSCGSGRTLAIWQSQDEMFEFVVSPAHSAAMTAAPEILKPGYGATHWEANAAEAMTMAAAAQRFASERAAP